MGAGSCFAFDEAVGAVRCDGRLTGLVTPLGFAAAVGEVFVLSGAGPARAIDAAVGAVKELLAGFEAADELVEVAALTAEGVLGCDMGDLTAFPLGLVADLVDMADGLLDIGVFSDCSRIVAGVGADVVDAVRSSATGGKACPPLTACASVRSAGFISPGSSSAPVTILSGFCASFSCACDETTS